MSVLDVTFLINNYRSWNVLNTIFIIHPDSVSGNNPIYLMFLSELLKLPNIVRRGTNTNRDDYEVFAKFARTLEAYTFKGACTNDFSVVP